MKPDQLTQELKRLQRRLQKLERSLADAQGELWLLRQQLGHTGNHVLQTEACVLALLEKFEHQLRNLKAPPPTLEQLAREHLERLRAEPSPPHPANGEPPENV